MGVHDVKCTHIRVLYSIVWYLVADGCADYGNELQ